MHSKRYALLSALLAWVWLMPATSAHGIAFTPAEQRCHDAMAVGATKLAQQIGRSITDCHRARVSGGSSATDCNDVETTPGVRSWAAVGKKSPKLPVAFQPTSTSRPRITPSSCARARWSSRFAAAVSSRPGEQPHSAAVTTTPKSFARMTPPDADGGPTAAFSAGA